VGSRRRSSGRGIVVKRFREKESWHAPTRGARRYCRPSPLVRQAKLSVPATPYFDMIETALRTNGFLFQRIDGQKSLEQRIRALHAFNNDPTCTVMLASIGSVAEG
jgi:hypothetical protein